MAFSQSRKDIATDSWYIRALTEELIQLLADGITIDSFTKTYHGDQYMVVGKIYFSNSTSWVLFGEDGNAENFDIAIRSAYHKLGTNYDIAENSYQAILTSNYRTNRVSDIKNAFTTAVTDKTVQKTIWVS